MKHIFLVDHLNKLNTKKDSSLMMAIAFQEEGHQTYLAFADNIAFVNHSEVMPCEVCSFKGSFKKDDYYIEQFEIDTNKRIFLEKGDVIHMRLDPPFDGKYLRVLWWLNSLKQRGVIIVNDPIGIMNNNEKLLAFEYQNSPLSFVGTSIDLFKEFTKDLIEKGYRDIIIKPLEGFSGYGVEKFSLTTAGLTDIFLNLVQKNDGLLIVQPFYQEVSNGEIRSVYFNGEELGTILKIPAAGEFLSNIAQGASFEAYKLNDSLRELCSDIALRLKEQGVPFVAFDLLGNMVTEVNVTCPGLLVEVSHALKKNLAKTIAQSFY